MPKYLTSNLPGTGGRIKESPEDFQVAELPAYEPCGSGEHLYLTIEKRGLTTLEAIRKIASSLKLNERDVGYAGMKDSVGVTRQFISLQRVTPEEVLGRDFGGVMVVAARRHTNKLKLGHLKGNRFRLVVREAAPDAAARAEAVLAILATRGVPNYFGYQRYGVQGNSHLIGRAMLRRDWQGAISHLIGEPEAVRDEQWQSAIAAYRSGDLTGALELMPRHCRGERSLLQRLSEQPDNWRRAFDAIHPRLQKLYLSACQSFLFDRLLEKRLDRFDQVMNGDLAWKHVNGACFLVEDEATENLRAAQFEISPTGPMFGPKMKAPGGAVLAEEQSLLAEESIDPENFDLGGGLKMEGERRPLRVPMGEPTLSVDQAALVLEFSLPKGSYATSVVREITKNF